MGRQLAVAYRNLGTPLLSIMRVTPDQAEMPDSRL
jgi:hypothetical protein